MLEKFKSSIRRRLTLGHACLLVVVVGAPLTFAACHGRGHVTGHTEHLCGVYGDTLKPQEWCPGISHPHHYEEAVVYREKYGAEDGIEMCMIVNNHENSRRLFSRCGQRATSIWVGQTDFAGGSFSSRVYCKNNNVAWGEFKCWAFADTEYGIVNLWTVGGTFAIVCLMLVHPKGRRFLRFRRITMKEITMKYPNLRRTLMVSGTAATIGAAALVPNAVSQDPAPSEPNTGVYTPSGMPPVQTAEDFPLEVKNKVAKFRKDAAIHVTLPEEAVRSTGVNGDKGYWLNTKKLAFPANGQICVGDYASGAGECMVESAVGRAFFVTTCDVASNAQAGQANVQGIILDGVKYVDVYTQDGKKTRAQTEENYLDVTVTGKPVKVVQANGLTDKLPNIEVPTSCIS